MIGANFNCFRKPLCCFEIGHFLSIFLAFSYVMGPKPTISLEKRAQMVVLKEDGYSLREIGERLGCNYSSVSYVLKKYHEQGSVVTLPRSGRPRKTDNRDDLMIKKVCAISPFYSSHQIKEELPQLNVSSRTIRRRLHDKFNLRARRPACKPLISKKNLNDRIKFCRKYRNWTKDDWSKVMFSDESSFSLLNSFNLYVRRPSGQRFNVKYTRPSVKHPDSCMVWGAFCASGRGPITFIPKETRINAQTYLEILKNKLKLFMNIKNCKIFQQDGAPCHTAKSVKQWLTENRIEVLDWPGNSPDLNPIENLWILMKRKIALRRPKSLPELRNAIQSVWVTDISRDCCQNLINSMPTRISLVLKAKGMPTRY